MTKEEKQLLLADLCAKLPYKVKGKTLGSKTCTLSFIGNDGSITADTYHCWLSSKQFVPYLRPMSSMTEEEKGEFENLLEGIVDGIERWDKPNLCEEYDWLNSHHFDYRGLIEKGLALPVPEGMYG